MAPQSILIVLAHRAHHDEPLDGVVGGALGGDPQQGELVLVLRLGRGVQGVAQEVDGLCRGGGHGGQGGVPAQEAHDVGVLAPDHGVQKILDHPGRPGRDHLHEPAPHGQDAVDAHAVNKRVDVPVRRPVQEVHDRVEAVRRNEHVVGQDLPGEEPDVCRSSVLQVPVGVQARQVPTEHGPEVVDVKVRYAEAVVAQERLRSIVRVGPEEGVGKLVGARKLRGGQRDGLEHLGKHEAVELGEVHVAPLLVEAVRHAVRVVVAGDDPEDVGEVQLHHPPVPVRVLPPGLPAALQPVVALKDEDHHPQEGHGDRDGQGADAALSIHVCNI